MQEYMKCGLQDILCSQDKRQVFDIQVNYLPGGVTWRKAELSGHECVESPFQSTNNRSLEALEVKGRKSLLVAFVSGASPAVILSEQTNRKENFQPKPTLSLFL